MKFTVTNDDTHELDLKIEFSNDEREDTYACIVDAALGFSRVILEMVSDCSNAKQAHTLADAMINQIKKSVSECIEEHFSETENVLKTVFYDLMERAFADWLDAYEISESTDNFVKKYSNKKLELKYILTSTEKVVIYLSVDNDEEFLDIMCFSISLLEKNEKEFNAKCSASELIATVAFDKLYGEDENPLRQTPIVSLENKIKKAIKARK